MYSTGILLYELLFNNEKKTNPEYDPLPNQIKANVQFGDVRFKWGEPLCLKGHKLIQEYKH